MDDIHVKEITTLITRSQQILSKLKDVLRFVNWEQAEVDRMIRLIEDTEKDLQSIISQVTDELFKIERRTNVDRRKGSIKET